MSEQEKLISIVVPVYQEEDVIRPFLERMRAVLEPLGSYEIIFCVDPGADGTVGVIEEEAKRDSRIGMILFSRRFGQPAATMAGILSCAGSWCAVIDVDLQDPPEVIPDMLAKAREGFDVVYAVRQSRQGETLAKRAVSWVGYKVINAIADVEIPRNAGDFRIISRRIVEQLRRLKETHGFLRGLVAFVGHRQTAVYYDRVERRLGRSKYSQITGSLKIGLNGIFSYSSRPLTFTLLSGVAIAAFSFVLATIMLVLRFFYTYPLGIPTITILVLFLGGVQLISVGVVGEYVGRIYDEVKRRPLYIVERAINVPRLADDAQAER